MIIREFKVFGCWISLSFSYVGYKDDWRSHFDKWRFSLGAWVKFPKYLKKKEYWDRNKSRVTTTVSFGVDLIFCKVAIQFLNDKVLKE